MEPYMKSNDIALAKENKAFSYQLFWIFLFIYFCNFSADLVGYFLNMFGYGQWPGIVSTLATAKTS